MRLLVQALFPIFVVLFRPFTAAGHRLQDRIRSIGKADWPTVVGRVYSVTATAHNHLWIATVQYSYSADGEYWSGSLTRTFSLERDADHYAAQHPVNSAVMVRYRPGRPEKSVVLGEDQKMVSQAGTI